MSSSWARMPDARTIAVAGQGCGQDAAAERFVVEVWDLVDGDGRLKGDLVALEGDLERCDAGHSGPVPYLGRVLGGEAACARRYVFTNENRSVVALVRLVADHGFRGPPGVRDRAGGGAESGLVRCLARVFENHGTVERVLGADPAGNGLRKAVFAQLAEWRGPWSRRGRHKTGPTPVGAVGSGSGLTSQHPSRTLADEDVQSLHRHGAASSEDRL
ncbi:MAG: hypothetical protein OXC14_18235 [Rhodospirillaceae bacterium]|nr:hypothetical protein [Rhodospirillaceae bacterium]